MLEPPLCLILSTPPSPPFAPYEPNRLLQHLATPSPDDTAGPTGGEAAAQTDATLSHCCYCQQHQQMRCLLWQLHCCCCRCCCCCLAAAGLRGSLGAQGSSRQPDRSACHCFRECGERKCERGGEREGERAHVRRAHVRRGVRRGVKIGCAGCQPSALACAQGVLGGGLLVQQVKLHLLERSPPPHPKPPKNACTGTFLLYPRHSMRNGINTTCKARQHMSSHTAGHRPPC